MPAPLMAVFSALGMRTFSASNTRSRQSHLKLTSWFQPNVHSDFGRQYSYPYSLGVFTHLSRWAVIISFI